jgi:hypothetical protein
VLSRIVVHASSGEGSAQAATRHTVKKAIQQRKKYTNGALANRWEEGGRL